MCRCEVFRDLEAFYDVFKVISWELGGMNAKPRKELINECNVATCKCMFGVRGLEPVQTHTHVHKN